MADMTIRQSNLYVNRDKNNLQFAIDCIDLARFLRVLLLSGYHCLAEEKDYWSNQPNLGVDIQCQHCLICHQPEQIPDHEEVFTLGR